MCNKKRVTLLLLCSLFILLLIPNAFAIFEFLYTGQTYFQDPLQIYSQFQGWIDFIIFAAIFTLLFMFLLERVFGGDDEEKKHRVRKLAGILGIAATLGVTYYGRFIGGPQEGLLVSLAPLWMLLLVTMLVYSFYKTFRGDENKPISFGIGLLLILISFVVLSLWLPNIFGPVLEVLLRIPIVPLILLGLMVIGVIALLLWIFGLGTRAFRSVRGSTSGGESPQEMPREESFSPTRLEEKIQPPQLPRKENLVVEIMTIPPPDKTIKAYKPGDNISIIAQVYQRRLLWKNRELREEFDCTWRIAGITQEDHSKIINYIMPQDLRDLEEDILIEVIVQDPQNRLRTGRKTKLIKVKTEIPKLIIIRPTDTEAKRDLIADIGTELEFEYRMDKLSPPDIGRVKWFYAKGSVLINEGIIKNAAFIGEGENFRLRIGEPPFNLEPGLYTIICVATNIKGKLYKFKQTHSLLADSFRLNVKPRPGKPQSPTQTHILTITEPITKERSRSKPHVMNYNTKVKLGIENVSPEITKIEWNLQANHKRQPSRDVIRKLGEGKEATALFLYDENMVVGILPEGEYTIFAYGYIDNALVVFDYIWINLVNIELKRQTKTEHLILAVYKQKVGESKASLVFSTHDDTIFKAKIGETYAFKPAVLSKEDNIAKYTTIIEAKAAGDFYKYDSKTRTAILTLRTPGQKMVVCIFKKGKEVISKITASIEVT